MKSEGPPEIIGLLPMLKRELAVWAGLAACFGVFALIGWWLETKIGWPDAYGVRCSYFKTCYWIELEESGLLLRQATKYELMFFAWLWIVPVMFVPTMAFFMVKRWWRRKR